MTIKGQGVGNSSVSVTFTPSNANYNSVTKTVTVTVNKSWHYYNSYSTYVVCGSVSCRPDCDNFGGSWACSDSTTIAPPSEGYNCGDGCRHCWCYY